MSKRWLGGISRNTGGEFEEFTSAWLVALIVKQQSAKKFSMERVRTGQLVAFRAKWEL